MFNRSAEKRGKGSLMGKLKILIVFLLLILPLSAVTNNHIIPGKIIIKLKDQKYSAYQTMGVIQEKDLPASVKNLNSANKVKEMKTLFDHKATRRRITFSPQVNSRLQKVEAESKSRGLDRLYTIEVPEDTDIEFLVAQYNDDENIEYAQPVYRYFIMTTTPDDMGNQDTNLPQVFATNGWDISTGNSSITIAIIDTGILNTHADLDNKIVSETDFTGDGNGDASGHGTAVAGVAAAETNNTQGMAGMDWNAKLMPLRIFDNGGSSNSIWVVQAVNFAMSNGADVINMSIGSLSADSSLKTACDTAYAADIIVVASMGNVDEPNGFYKTSVVYPAAFDSVIGVGATDSSDDLTSWSIIGSGAYTTEIVAPGENIYTTTLAPGYGKVFSGGSLNGQAISGTSFSSPLVAGLASLMKATHSGATASEIRQYLHDTADDLGDDGYDSSYGYGRVNAYQALTLTSSKIGSARISLREVMNFPNPTDGDHTYFSFKPTEYIRKSEIVIYTLSGKEVAQLEGGTGMAGFTYKVYWDCTNSGGQKLANGTYLYVITAFNRDGQTSVVTGKMSIVK